MLKKIILLEKINKLVFEDKIQEIDDLIRKNRNRWLLSDIGGFGYDDVAQTIRLHIYEKWDLWDQSRPFPQWCNRLIINQIKNIVRDRYSRDAPPCNGCQFNRGGELCGYTESGLKCTECILYKKWVKKKKDKFFLRYTLSMDNENFVESHAESFSSTPETAIEFESSTDNFHRYIRQFLTPRMLIFYHLICERKLTDAEVSKELKKLTDRGMGPRQLVTIKGYLRDIAQQHISDFDPAKKY